MSYKRLDPRLVTPVYEDAGLFKNTICHVQVDLAPLIERNQREDLIVTGYVQGNLRISVLFAGRRALEAAPTMAMLNTLKEYAIDAAKERNAFSADLASIRVPTKIEGAWRSTFIRDHTGWETKSYYLIAARWVIANSKGEYTNFGESPQIPERVA